MEEVIVYGYQFWSLTDERTGELRQGYSYHMACMTPPNTSNFVGTQVQKLSVPKSVYDSWVSNGNYIPAPGDRCYIILGFRGALRLILLFVLVAFVGLGVGLIRRMIRL